MTAQEITNKDVGEGTIGEKTISFWLKEVAFQLATFNELIGPELLESRERRQEYEQQQRPQSEKVNPPPSGASSSGD